VTYIDGDAYDLHIWLVLDVSSKDS